MVLLLSYLFLALFVSFLCSIMEAVLLSTPLSYISARKENGDKWAISFLELKNNIDKPLSAILSLNTVAHTIGAAGVGAQATKIFGEAYFGIVSAILTILILVITEIIPKTIGARFNRGLAKVTTHIIGIMIIITYPLVVLSAKITRLISSKKVENSISREEISALASIGADEGLFNEKEHKIIQNLLLTKNIKATQIMTPRVVLVTANENLSVNDFYKNVDVRRFSRIPVYSVKEENITGYVLRQTALEKLAEDNHELKLLEIKRKILVLPKTLYIFTVWEKMLQEREHLALIIDEYGGVEGIVTMEDIIETLIGQEIIDELDTIPDLQKYARDKWKNKLLRFKKNN